MTEDNKTSAEAWLYGQKKTKKSFLPEAYENYWREQTKEKVEVAEEEEESKTEVKILKRKV